MLRALKQLLRPGGRVAYTTIFVASGLDPARRRRAIRSGPRAVSSRADQRQLLVSAGFVDIDAVDLTSEWAHTARGWLAGWAANEAELSALESPEAFAQRQRERRTQLRALDVRDDPLRVRKDRLPRRGAEDQDQAVVPRAPAACRCARYDHDSALRPRAMTHAAEAPHEQQASTSSVSLKRSR